MIPTIRVRRKEQRWGSLRVPETVIWLIVDAVAEEIRNGRDVSSIDEIAIAHGRAREYPDPANMPREHDPVLIIKPEGMKSDPLPEYHSVDVFSPPEKPDNSEKENT
ncbi:MAG: hypothetical protein GY841_16010 [FCB group bacterium]|nr:hypothetical protein [FCB group bacterium]